MRIIVAALLALAGMVLCPQAEADDDCPGAQVHCDADATPNGFVTAIGDGEPGESSPGSPGIPVVPTATDLVNEGLDAVCVTTAIEQQEDPVDYCGLDVDGNPPELTGGMVAAAFKTIPMPASTLIIEPPNGRTLVNFETNFYTDNRPFDVQPFTLVGHTIELHVVPAEFTWRYGDGTQDTTTTPGAAYPDLQITHAYQRKGEVGPSVDTTYAATYRVDREGPWRDVDGTVTIAGTPGELEVLTATPVLVGSTRATG